MSPNRPTRMIHHRKKGLIIIHGSAVLIAQQALYLPFLLADRTNAVPSPMEDVALALYFVALLVSGLLGFVYYRDYADRLPHFGLFNSISLANRQAVTLGGVFVLVLFLAKDQHTSRLLLAGVVAASWFLTLVLNYYVPPFLSQTLFGGTHTVPTLLVGSEKTALKLKNWIDRSESLGFRFEGLVTYQAQDDTPSIWGIPVIGDITQIANVIREKGISQVIVLETMGSRNWLDYLVDVSMDRGCRVLIYNNWEEMFDRPMTLVHEGEHTFFSFQEEPLQNPINRFLKRTFDLVVALPVCLLVVPLLMAVCAPIMRVQSPGPLLYRQVRCGRGGRHFTILKFRSMHPARAATVESKQARRGDDRVFPLGRLLRRFSLDELPQFYNVLAGQMSVVGPRPHLAQHDEIFAKETKYYRTRFFVKPGITGLAQVKGYRGEITDPSVLHERVRWDLAYIRGWSIWLDGLIVLRTVRHMVLPPTSAY